MLRNPPAMRPHVQPETAAALFISLLAITILAFAPSAGRLTDWWIAAETKNARTAIDPQTGDRHELPARPAGSALSPDKSKIAFVRTFRAGDRFAKELFTANPDGTGERQLTSGAIEPRDPVWTPDGNGIVYVRGTGDRAQVYLMDLTDPRRTERRISGGGSQSWNPDVAPDGRIAYVVLREQRGKEQMSDLVIYENGRRTTIAERLHITDVAFSPDGDRIACGTIGQLLVHDFDTGRTQTRSYQEIDERLYAHAARDLAWRPDGQVIAARITFVGGRLIEAGQEPPVLFGDVEIFFIPVVGKASWCEGPTGCAGLEWIDAKDAAGAKNDRSG